jgi:hypothetical protein
MIEEAKRLEKKLVEYAPYQGAIEVERTLDLEPKEYVDLNYADLINMYERTQKIISASGLGVFASVSGKAAEDQAAAPAPKAVTSEVENRLREMTSETLKTAEQVAKEPMITERAPPQEIEFERHEEAKPEIEFEFKEAPSKKEAEKAVPQAPEPEISLEEKTQPKAPEEKDAPPVLQKPREAPSPKAEIPPQARTAPGMMPAPPALRESPDQAGARRYSQMEEQISAAIGEKADEVTLKRKMLDLTKQLFKEKSTSKREDIKLQITVLKNMLASGNRGQKAGAKAAVSAKGAAPEGDTHIKLLDTLIATHQSELSQNKDDIISSYNKRIADIKKGFYDDIAVTDDPGKRKQMFEAFVFAVESLVEQLPDNLAKQMGFTSKKHASELERLHDSLGAKESDTKGKVEERLDYTKKGYEKEYSAVKGIVGRQIENLIEVAGSEIFKKAEERPEESESRIYEIVKEVNETDEGTLLYFLHSKDPESYKKYERKQLSKAEVIFKAKELLARDKGLSDSIVKKYFSQMEG